MWNHSWVPIQFPQFCITGSYLNPLMRRQIVRISGTISLQVIIPISETVPLNQSQYSFHFENISVPLVSSLQKHHLCTHNIYMFIDCLCMGSHNAGMLPYIHVGHPKSRQLSVLVGRTVIISQHDSASSLQSPTQVPAQQLWLVGTFCSAVGLHLPQCTDLKQNVMYAVQSIKCSCLPEWL